MRISFLGRNALLAGMLALPLALAGCAGDDGKNGTSCSIADNGDGTATITCGSQTYDVADGADGTSCSMVDNLDGTATITCGSTVYTVGTPTATVESCAGCHNTSLPTTHALSDKEGTEVKLQHWSASGAAVKVDDDGDPGTPTVQLPAVSVDVATNTVTVRFNVRVNGTPRYDFVNKAQDVLAHNEDAWWVYSLSPTYTQAAPNDTGPAGVRTKITSANWTLVHSGNGNYTATILPTAFTAPVADGTVFMLSTMNPAGATATAVATFGTSAHDVVGDQACINCHGNHVWRGANHDVTSPQGVGPCIVCHNRVGSADPRLSGAGTGLMGIVHGIHNSHNMPDGQYTFTWTNGNQFNFSIGFPGYMNNCTTCHDSAARLAQVTAAPVSYELCISCHDSFSAFANAPASHDAFTATPPWAGQTSCAVCHTETVADFHNGQKTERNGLIWDGSDVSVDEGAKFALAVTGVTRAGANFQVTWTASYDGAPVDPCNTDFGVGPVFLDVASDTNTGKSSSNMQFIMAFGQGDDWVNANRTGNVSPGQPATGFTLTVAGIPASGSTSAVAPNTTCSANVATSNVTIPTDGSAAAGLRAAMALQGKPQLRFAAAVGTSGEFIQARAKSPVFNYVVPAADGAATAGAARRTIVDTAKCLDCHKGTLYQHGGNRVDNVDLCVTCHNPAANETNVRVGFGVDATEAYDGKPGEAYDMRNMIHAIHSAGETGRSYVIYRTRGIYFFGNAESYADVVANKNWPTTGGITCVGSEGPVTYYKVYGSIATGNVPQANPDGTCKTSGLVASTDGSWQVHNVILVEYPQPLNNCGACHASSWVPAAVDATKGVAMTVDAGAAPWGNQLDDVLMGPTAASCMSCHQSGDPVIQSGLRQHAGDFGGWTPTVFVNGRQTLIDSVSLP